MLIKKVLTCWGDLAYYGYVGGKQYTEDYYSPKDLIADYPEFAHAKVIKQTSQLKK